MSKSSAPIPQPSAAIIVLISSLPSILSKRAFSTFRIFPLSGRMAWNRRSRPCFADPLDLGVAGRCLRLTFELRMRDLDADDRRQPFANVVAGDALLQVFRQVVLGGVEVDRAGQRRAEPGQVRAALVRVDVVGK